MFAVGTTEKKWQSIINTKKDEDMDGDNSSSSKKLSTGSVPSLKKNYLYNLIYQIVQFVVPLIVTPYVSRVLRPEGVGEYSYVYSVITYFTMVVALGFGIYAQREVAKCRNDQSAQTQIFWEVFLLRLMFGVGSAIVLVSLIVSGVFAESTQLFAICGINILATCVDIVFIFEGNEQFRRIAVRNTIFKILSVAAIFLFVKKEEDLWIYALVMSITPVISNFSLWLYLPKMLGRGIKRLHIFRHLLPSLKLFVPTLATVVYAVFDKTLIKLLTGSEAEVGYYEQAEKMAKIGLTFLTALGTVVLPRNAYYIKIKAYDKVKENIYIALRFAFLLGFPLIAGLIVVAPKCVPWFLGAGYERSIFLLQLLSLLILPIGLSNVLGMQLLLAMGKDGRYTISLLTGAAINIILNLIMIPRMGAAGAAIATIIAETTITILQFVFVRHDLSMKKVLLLTVRYLICSLVMFGILFVTARFLEATVWATILLVTEGVSIYFLLLLISKDPIVFTGISFILGRFRKHKPIPALEPSDGETVGADDNGNTAESSPEREAAATDDAGGAGTDEERGDSGGDDLS